MTKRGTFGKRLGDEQNQTEGAQTNDTTKRVESGRYLPLLNFTPKKGHSVKQIGYIWPQIHSVTGSPMKSEV